MTARRIFRVLAVLVVLFTALCTYPGASIASFIVGLTPPLRAESPAPAGVLSWLHVEHPSGGTPFIADDGGRLVLLHGATPIGLIDYWSGTDPSRTDPPPFYPTDPAVYDTGCPANASLINGPPLCRQDITQMAAFGFNSIRLPLSWSLIEPQRGQFNEPYLDRVAQVVGWARDAGMHVIIDLHQDAYSRYIGRADPPPLPAGDKVDLNYADGAPAWATYTDGLPSEVYGKQRELNPTVLEANTNFWYNRDGVQTEYIAMVAHLVSRFKNDSTVVGFSVFNEPHPGWNLPPGFEDLLLFPFYRRVIDAVTGAHDGLPCPTQIYMPAVCGYPDLGVHDRRHLFFIEPGLLREVTDFPTHLGLPVSSYQNLVLSIHAYTHGYTIETFIGQKPDHATYPWGGYDQTYGLAEREAKAINAALFVSEFGNDPKWDPLILTNELLEQERHLVGFAFWDWKENCGSWGMFDGVQCDAAGRATAQPSSGCLRPTRERLLARVYPVASADPTLTYHYDASTGAFTLRAHGQLGDLPTVVVVPVEVTGAVTVSGAVAGEPGITPSGGGRTVTVYPAGGEFSIAIAVSTPNSVGCG